MAVMAGTNVRYREWLKTGERMLARTASRSGWHRYCCLVGGTGGGGGVGWDRTKGSGAHSRRGSPNSKALIFTQKDFMALSPQLHPLQTRTQSQSRTLSLLQPLPSPSTTPRLVLCMEPSTLGGESTHRATARADFSQFLPSRTAEPAWKGTSRQGFQAERTASCAPQYWTPIPHPHPRSQLMVPGPCEVSLTPRRDTCSQATAPRSPPPCRS